MAQNPRHVVDVTGDGKADIVGFGEHDAYVGYSTGSGFGVTLGSNLYGRNDGWDKTRTIRTMADVNGDRMADIVAFGEHETSVGISSRARSGQVFTIYNWSNDFDYDGGWRNANHLRTAGDVTGDGKADLIAIGANEGIVGVSAGISISPALYY